METFHVSAVVVKDKKILLINTKNGPGKWTIPGGKAKENEHVLKVMKKELKEECGIGIEDRFDFLWNYRRKYPDGRSIKGFCFRVWPKSKKVELEKGRKDFRWVTVGEAEKLDMDKELKENIKKNSWKWLKRPKRV